MKNENKGKTKAALTKQLEGPLSYYVAQYGNRKWIWEAVARACGRALGTRAKQEPKP